MLLVRMHDSRVQRHTSPNIAAGRFGSGWAWLGVKADGSLTIGSTPNQDNPLMSLADQVCAFFE